MKFYIEELVLWPVNEKNEIHTLKFRMGKVNIIHGRSRTGKSSIIAIIDYCLGASRCAIPVGIIRNNVEWFGVVAYTYETRLLIARRTPRNKYVSSEFYLKVLKEDEHIPKNILANTNDVHIKSIFNDRVTKLTNLPQTLRDGIGQFEGRPSYRDLAAFNFLPQHIVANPNTFFYKADSYEHKERLKKILPLALGIVNNDYLTKERERANLQREYDNLIKMQEARTRALTAWEADIDALWNQSVELGLIEPPNIDTTDIRLKKFKEINDIFNNNDYDTLLKTPDYLYTNQKYKKYMHDEEALQKKVDKLRGSIRSYESLAGRASDFTYAINFEKNRIINFDWLKKNLGKSNECIACGSNTSQLHQLVNNLEKEVIKVNELSQVLFESPIVDKEIEASKIELMKLQSALHEVRVKRLHLEKVNSAAKDSLSRVFILIGRIQSLLINYAEKNNEDSFGVNIIEIRKKIQKLDEFFMHSGKLERENAAYNELSTLISNYAKDFKLEQRGIVNLDNVELTLSFKKDLKARKKEYLWEVGSGANWMGYHIATFLAIHQYLSKNELNNSPVFSFLVIDQPSQVYFPSAVSGANQLDGKQEELHKLKLDREDDIQATKRIFEMLELGLKNAGYQYQIIVLEHADQTIWGDQPHTIEVANWKEENEGLIPSYWIQEVEDDNINIS